MQRDMEGWDVPRLRQALVRFNAAVEIEKDEEKEAADKAKARAQYAGDPSLGVIRRAVGGSVARGFVKEVSEACQMWPIVIVGREADGLASLLDQGDAGRGRW
jgi:hypothetical protein